MSRALNMHCCQVGFHALDFITDVGFFFEDLNSKEFEQQYESACQVQVVCIVSLVLSLLVWFVRTFATEGWCDWR